jgi:hypothetical protein
VRGSDFGCSEPPSAEESQDLLKTAGELGIKFSAPRLLMVTAKNGLGGFCGTSTPR